MAFRTAYVIIKNQKKGGLYDRTKKMPVGELYDCGDKELLDRWHEVKDLIRDYNKTDSKDMESKEKSCPSYFAKRGKSLDYRPVLRRLWKQYLFWQQLRSQYELRIFR